MENLNLFLIKSIAISGMFTILYLLALRGRRLHQYNRFFLLSVLLFSMGLPLLHFRVITLPQIVSGSFAPVAVFGQAVAGTATGSAPVADSMHVNWWSGVMVVIATVSLSLLLVLFRRVYKVLRIKSSCETICHSGRKLVMTHVPGAPFSFLNTIYWNQDIPLNDAVGQLILRHEITHVTQGHSYDKLLSQIMACLFWFNPFYWIVQHELAIVHEFIADEAAVSNRDPKVFSLMLLGACSKGRRLVPQHHFFASAVKRRLNMLQANRPGSAIVRCLAALPVLAASVFFCSFGISAPAANALTPASSPIVLLVDAAHGGSDAGASAGGYREKDISLQYALRLKELAAKYNIEVQLTRNDDRSLSLGERVALAGKIHPDLFLSLHVAAETGAGAARRGIEMFVSGENSWAPQSGSYGGAMLGMMARNGFISNQPGRKHEKGCSCGACTGNSPLSAGDVPASVKNGIFVLKNVQAPSVVIELGDINEVQSMARLTDEGQIDQLCNALLQGIVNGASQLRQKATDPLNFMNNKKGAPACDK